MFNKLFVAFFLALVSAQGLEALHVTKCKSSDAKCIRASTLELLPTFGAGIPELKVAPFDPLHIDTLDASTDDLKLVLRDVTVVGLSKCDVKRAERDAAKSKLYLAGTCDLDLKSKYEMDGHIAVLSIQGNGDAHVQLKKIFIDFEGDLVEKTDKKGIKHWDIKSFRHSYDLKDNAKIRMSNLFNGNKELADAVNTFFDTSPNEVVKAIGTPLVKGLITVLVKNVNHFFHRMPVEDLSIN